MKLTSSRFLQKIFIALGLAASAGCGNNAAETMPQSTDCPTGLAVIQVFDGFLRIACGCAEPAGTLTASGTQLTCTVPSGSQVQFQFDGILIRHQIIPDGTPEIIPSLLVDPTLFDTTLPHRVVLPAPGTYLFRDAFDRNLNGRLIAL